MNEIDNYILQYPDDLQVKLKEKIQNNKYNTGEN